MSIPIERIQELLREYLSAPSVREEARGAAGSADVILRVKQWRLLVEFKTNGAPGPVARAIETLRRERAQPTIDHSDLRTIPLVVVPRMGPAARAYCDAAGVSWLGLDGNAHITADDLTIRVEGKLPWKGWSEPPTRRNPFGARSSRLIRVLLSAPTERWTQQRLVAVSGLDKGWISALVRELDRDGYVRWAPAERLVSVVKPRLLLDAWRDRNGFERHTILRGTLASRSGPELLHSVSAVLRTTTIDFAATGLAAAWQYVRYADFRTTTIYVREFPDTMRLWNTEFTAQAHGANLWLVRPKDDGVFDGCEDIDEVPCVSVVQAYVDLAAHPERADEAAIELRQQRLPWAAQ